MKMHSAVDVKLISSVNLPKTHLIKTRQKSHKQYRHVFPQTPLTEVNPPLYPVGWESNLVLHVAFAQR